MPKNDYPLKNRKKVLLLNPPGEEKYFRDNYCSPVSKVGYYWQPTDLLVQSGYLGRHFHIDVLDAIVENLSSEQVINSIKAGQYDAILTMIGTASWDEDLMLMEQVRELLPQAIIALSGNIALFEYKWTFETYDCIDVCLLDYTTDDFTRFLLGDIDNLLKLVYRKGNDIIVNDKPAPKQIAYPIPLHHKFQNELYHLPLSIKHPSAIVITSAGCPHKCEFCVASEIPYRFRTVDDVIKELTILKEMGIKEVFFQDFMFDVKYDRTRKLCETLINKSLGLSWYCSCRVDTLDEPLLKLMKEAGCHTIQFGIESSQQVALNLQKKKSTTNKVQDTLALCNKVGIRVFGHFIIGLPGETESTMLQQGKYARKLGCHNAVFDTLVPDVGTELRRKAIAEGKIANKLTLFSNSDKEFDVSLTDVDSNKLTEIRRKVMLDFYLHPKFIWNSIMKLKSFYELKQKVKFGMALFKNV